ncbi:MAG: ketopantoate reductase family protein, partial [Candidatus Thermoplasmatota archaeon]
MNIVVFGAGAIGSLFGAFLSKENNVILVGRPDHVEAVNQNGLKVKGKTSFNVEIEAVTSIDQIDFTPDVVLLTVKSYDTEEASSEITKLLKNNDAVVLSLQNGLDNIEKIQKYVENDRILAGVTTYGSFFSSPGVVEHTGTGDTLLGELNNESSKRLKKIVKTFNKSGIKTFSSENIQRDIWKKAIVNACINPITGFFECRNGYLLENLVLKNIVKKICEENLKIVKRQGFDFSKEEIMDATFTVIKKTSDNHSSLYQSLQHGKKTEINSINGVLMCYGKKYGIDC